MSASSSSTAACGSFRVRLEHVVTGDPGPFEPHCRPGQPRLAMLTGGETGPAVAPASEFAKILRQDVAAVSGASRQAEPNLDVRRLYASHGIGTSPLLGAIALLDEGLQRVDAARHRVTENDVLAADDELSALTVVLAKLFGLRDLGEGFGNLVSSLLEVLGNAKGHLPNAEQLGEVSRVLTALRAEPCVQFEASLKYVEALRAVGLEDAPAEIVGLADAVAESCPR